LMSSGISLYTRYNIILYTTVIVSILWPELNICYTYDMSILHIVYISSKLQIYSVLLFAGQ